LFPGIVLVSSLSPLLLKCISFLFKFLMFVLQSNQNHFRFRPFHIVCLIKYACSVTRNCIEKLHNQGVKTVMDPLLGWKWRLSLIEFWHA
jgi:hypothetical protein